MTCRAASRRPESSARSWRADMHDEWQVSDRRYLSKRSMALLNPTSDTGPVAALGAGD
jgi:hypothetical protein